MVGQSHGGKSLQPKGLGLRPPGWASNLNANAAVLCSTCQTLRRMDPVRKRTRRFSAPWRANFAATEQCEACGNSLGCPEAGDGLIAQVLRLAKFGLAAGARPLLDYSRDNSSQPGSTGKDW